MSEIQANVSAKIAEKITNMRGGIAQAGDDVEAKGEEYARYNLYFQGLKEGMELARAEPEDVRPVEAALNVIGRQLDALEAEAALSEMINGA